MNSTCLGSDMGKREEGEKHQFCSHFLWKCNSNGLSLAISAVLELHSLGPRSNFPAAEVKALPPQLLNLTNYTWVYSNMKKCALCSWPLGQHRDQIPAHRKAPLIFIKSHGRPALHFCWRGERGTGYGWATQLLCAGRIHRLLAADQLVPGFFFFFLYSILVTKEHLKLGAGEKGLVDA